MGDKSIWTLFGEELDADLEPFTEFANRETRNLAAQIQIIRLLRSINKSADSINCEGVATWEARS